MFSFLRQSLCVDQVSLQLIQNCLPLPPEYLDLRGVSLFPAIVSSWWTVLLTNMKSSSLLRRNPVSKKKKKKKRKKKEKKSSSYLSIFGLKSILSDIRIAMPTCFLVSFAWNTFSHPFTLRWWCLSLVVRYICWRQHKNESCLLIQFTNPIYVFLLKN